MVILLKRSHFLILILLLSTCFNNAERDNPLDPQSKNYRNTGILQGYVYTYYPPFQPIASAVITIIPELKSTFTDESGHFSFANLNPGNYQLKVNFSNFAPDSVQIEVYPNKTTAHQFNLDGLPKLDSLTLITGYRHQPWPLEPDRLLECIAQVSDPDGPADIASVSVMIPEFEFSDTLQILETAGIYQKRYEENALPVDQIEALFGHAFYIEIMDKVGHSQRFGPHFLIRLIENEPKIDSPQGSVPVGQNPTLKWYYSYLPFSFTYRVEVFQIIDQSLYIPIISVSDISPETLEYQVEVQLQPGSYLWTISIVDQFGNWSRSKKATFQVGN